MRKLGLIGGMSWVSTAIYYDKINRGVTRRVGGLSSAPLLIESLDFAPVAQLQSEERWDELGALLAQAGKRLQKAGADGLILCSNSIHRVYDQVADAVGVPMLHIADVTAAKLVQDGVKRAGLIGTSLTMREPFYRERVESHGIQVSVPDAATIRQIDRIIYEELGRSIVSRESQRTMRTCLTIMGQARNQAVILGCTELVMIVDPVANVIPVYDATALHSQAAVNWILTEPASEAPTKRASAHRTGR